MENLSYKLIPIFNPILPSQFPIPPKISNFNFLAIPYNKSLNPLNLKIKKTLLKNGWYTPSTSPLALWRVATKNTQPLQRIIMSGLERKRT